tara:strand:+ start:4085 stop:4261 length:177 start_codon:yes stop_codon:yes gene_type:complete
MFDLSKEIYKIFKYFKVRIAKYMIKKKTIMAEEICTMLSPGGIYRMRLSMPDAPQKIT